MTVPPEGWDYHASNVFNLVKANDMSDAHKTFVEIQKSLILRYLRFLKRTLVANAKK